MAPAESIRQLARDFAAAERAVCYGRMGVSTQAFGTLLPVAGATDQPGHRQPRPGRRRAVHLAGPGPGGEYLGWPLRPAGAAASRGCRNMAAKAGGGIGGRNPRRRRGAGARAGHGSRQPGAVHAQREAARTGPGLEFMLSIDLYINETTRYADLILPPTAPLEHDHYDTTFNVFAVRNVTRFNEAVLPRPEVAALRHWEIFVGLARAFAARNGLELKPTLEPQQMIDLGLRRWCLRRPFRAQAEPGHSARTSPRHRPRAAAAEPGAAPEDRRPAHPGRAASVRRRPATLRRTATACVRPVAADRRRHVRSNNSWMHNYHRLRRASRVTSC